MDRAMISFRRGNNNPRPERYLNTQAATRLVQSGMMVPTDEQYLTILPDIPCRVCGIVQPKGTRVAVAELYRLGVYSGLVTVCATCDADLHRAKWRMEC